MPDVLLRFRRAVGGLGSLGGPYRTTGRRDMYRWEASSRANVAAVFQLLEPWLSAVKLSQFASALGGAVPALKEPDGDDIWCAWAAGLFDGEGCSALLRHRTHDGYLTPELSVTQASKVGSPLVLERFLAIVRAGAISGPYAQRGATMPVYRWKAAARDDAIGVIQRLWPWLSHVKRVQAQRVLDTLAAQPELPRGNPAWGNNKTRCVNGHEYATARIRPFVARKGGAERRPSSGCLECLREYARRRRAEKKRSAADGDRRSVSEQRAVYGYKRGCPSWCAAMTARAPTTRTSRT